MKRNIILLTNVILIDNLFYSLYLVLPSRWPMKYTAIIPNLNGVLHMCPSAWWHDTGAQLPKNALRPVEGKGCVVVIDGMALIPDVGGILAVESK